MKRDVRLVVSEGPFATLAKVVNGVLSLADGADVAEYMGRNPWGDLDRYVCEVQDPLRGIPPRSVGDEAIVSVLVVPADDVALLNRVLDGFSECYSGGRPWSSLSDQERAAAERLAAQLS